MTGEEATLTVIHALEALALPYMVVGSFSSNLYGVPRATQDSDLVIHLGSQSITLLTDRLGPAFRLDPQMSFETVTMTTRHVLKVVDGHFKIELLQVSEDPHDQERFRRRRQVKFRGQDVYFATPEDVLITKLQWALVGGRNEDSDDIRNLIAVQGHRLDWDYIHSWCDRHGTRGLLEAICGSLPADAQ